MSGKVFLVEQLRDVEHSWHAPHGGSSVAEVTSSAACSPERCVGDMQPCFEGKPAMTPEILRVLFILLFNVKFLFAAFISFQQP